MTERTSQRNASDPQKVAAQERVVRERERQEASDLAAVMSTKQGRRMVWRLLGKCRVHQSIYETSARIHYNAGQQDIGHWLMANVISIDPSGWLIMQQEAIARGKRQSETAEAGQTASAASGVER